MSDKIFDYRLAGHEPLFGHAFYGGTLPEQLKRAAKFIRKNEIEEDVLSFTVTATTEGGTGVVLVYGSVL